MFIRTNFVIGNQFSSNRTYWGWIDYISNLFTTKSGIIVSCSINHYLLQFSIMHNCALFVIHPHPKFSKLRVIRWTTWVFLQSWLICVIWEYLSLNFINKYVHIHFKYEFLVEWFCLYLWSFSHALYPVQKLSLIIFEHCSATLICGSQLICLQ